MSVFLRFMKEGVDDLAMVSNPSNGEITKQIGARYGKNLIYTNIGDVLIAVNPYTRLPIYTEDHIKMYMNSNIYDSPPHIYQLAEQAYRTMVSDGSSQAVIISGESGAGKTESAKLILNYISAVSGSTGDTARVKDVILSTNPLLESFGNAKTVRNDNSSRFGKYLEILFNEKGEPCGGQITNFLLEKTRVAFQAKGERNFHIFYELVKGAPPQLKQELGLTGGPESFFYLSQSKCTTVDGVDDAKGFEDVCKAMTVIDVSATDQQNCWKLLAAILHVGNIRFEGDAPARVSNKDTLDFAAYLLGLDPSTLAEALVHRAIQTGSARASVYSVPQNPDQASGIRDALAKSLYERIFDWLVHRINVALGSRGTPVSLSSYASPVSSPPTSPRQMPSPNGGGGPPKMPMGRAKGPGPKGPGPKGPGPKGPGMGGPKMPPPMPGANNNYSNSPPIPKGPKGQMGNSGGGNGGFTVGGNGLGNIRTGGKSIGVLDIYGFEIFEANGFEQFCINYVNERLQQVFIDLTLRQEQKEYHDENLPWKDIKYFDNKVVVDLIEGNNPPGIFRLLDDTCKTVHALDSATCDGKFMEKVMKTHPHNEHLIGAHPTSFTVKHYAGEVTYTVEEFCFKNYDNLYTSLVMCMQTSDNSFYLTLFPEDVSDEKKAPTTSGMKIRQSANMLMSKLSACVPHYIRCIKPNDKKQPLDFVMARVEHQVKYLGLLENVRVKKAGYSYRTPYSKWVRRFSPLLEQPPAGEGQDAARTIVNYLIGKMKDVSADEFGWGSTKIFVKSPEVIFTIEEMLEQKVDPEGYKNKVKDFKESERKAKANQGKFKGRCLIQ